MVRRKTQPQARVSQGSGAGVSGRSPDENSNSEEIINLSDDSSDEDNELACGYEVLNPRDYEEFNPRGSFYRQKRKKKASAPKKKKKVVDYGSFQDILDSSTMKIEIYKEKPEDSLYLFSKIKITLQDIPDVEIMDKCSSFWMYICPDQQKSSALYFEWPAPLSSDPTDIEFKHCIIKTDLESYIWDSFKMRKYFYIHLNSYDDNFMDLDIFLERTGISQVSHPSNSANSFKNTEILMKHFYGLGLQSLEQEEVQNHDIDSFFKELKMFNNNKPSVDVEAQHQSLLPLLRPYQKEAVKWMLYQEQPKPPKDQLHPLYEEVKLLDGTVLYYNVAGCYLVEQKPLEIATSPGGILADEMGLGKTVEVLACMLNNPRKDIESLLISSQQKNLEVASDSEESDDSYIMLSDDSSDASSKGKRASKQSKVFAKQIREDEDSDSSVEIIVKRKRKPLSDGEALKDDHGHGPVVSVRDDGEAKQIYCSPDTNSGMSLKERLSFHYQNALAPYSAKSAAKVTPRWNAKFFDTKVERRTFFECICGKAEYVDKKLVKVKCRECSLSQHAECVQYDLNNPLKEGYLCPHCWVTAAKVPSRATLIIAPSTITGQWVDEIKKHLKEKSIKMIVYNGVAKESYIQPVSLADADIVITAYETLQKELDYVDLPHSNSESGRRLRFPKRFMATPSPLPCIEWWRICLDEAQMVESPNKAAAMALRLSSVNRWCVTGTPVEYSIDDLQGLLLFLGVDPYGIAHWWKKCVYEPFCHGDKEKLMKIASQYMWRNSKKDVQSQLNIPGQIEEVHWLDFTPVETHFYRRLHQTCYEEQQQRLKKIEDHNQKLCDLDGHTFFRLLQPLLNLRHACNHPQVVRGQFTTTKKNMTMEELLENLVQKAKLEAEECHRTIVACHNGMAAIHIIDKDYNGAVDIYRNVLKTIDDASQTFRTDSLQKLHTLHNLHEILQCKETTVAPTLRDSQLLAEADAIRKKYLHLHPTRIAEYKEECEEDTQGIITLERDLKSKVVWYLVALESFNDDFVTELRSEILARYSRFEQKKSVFHPVENRIQLLSLLQKYSKDTVNLRKKMLQGVQSLLDIDASEFLNEAIDCHLRPSAHCRNIVCKICKVHGFFAKYEEVLFSMKESKQNRQTERAKETEDVKEKARVFSAQRKGTWGCNDIEVALKYLQTKCLSRVGQDIMDDSQVTFQILQAMKKEFKNYRILWRGIFDHVSALDEVNMATIRLRLKYPGEKLPKPKKKKKKKDEEDLSNEEERPSYILERAEVPGYKAKFQTEEVVFQNDLTASKRQLLFLQNLQKESQSDGEKQPCPVCQGNFGNKWAVFQCNHSFCLECTEALCRQVARLSAYVKCPLCRQPADVKQINFVQMNKEENEEPTIKIQGSLSTKMEGVVRTMLEIKERDPQGKVLLFSTWIEVLQVLSDSLAQNGIIHRTLLNSNHFQTNLSAFKASEEITALLLPVHLGANGLNLTEATHIILVEPILNKGEELQALGRIHRIGQTKTTYVHRMVVRNTIEEKIYHTMSRNGSEDEYSLTVGDINEMFQSDHGVP